MSQFIPPNGMAGFAQQTAAVQAIYRGKRGNGGGRRRRKKKAAGVVARGKRKVKRAASSKAKRFTKGSAAAKRHMAKLRRMRKR